MGATLSINKKELFKDCSFWNLKTREQAKSWYWSWKETKENKVSNITACDSLAAYLQKCANVGKKKMRSKIEPAPPGIKYATKNINGNENDENTYKVDGVRNERAENPQNRDSQNAVRHSALNVSAVKSHAKPNSPFTLSSDALKCIGNFVKNHCKNLSRVRSSEVVLWLRGVDRALLLQGWQDQAFLTPPNLVFLYMLLKEALSAKCNSVAQLRSEVLTCLYMAYTYSGPEISYPLKPFLVDGNREAFWSRCVQITNNLSGKMLQTNRDPKYFSELLVELKTYSCVVDRRDG